MEPDGVRPDRTSDGVASVHPNWTEAIVDAAFTSATITVEQPAGTVVLVVSRTFGSPTANGPLPGGNVSRRQTQF